MAIRVSAAGDKLTGTTTLPPVTAFTAMTWAKISVDTNGFASFITFGENSGGFWYYYMGTFSDGTTFNLFQGTSVQGSALTVGTWNHVAMTVAGTGASQFLGYLNGALNITHNGQSNALAQEITVGASPDGNQANACFAATKIYSVVLTANEIRQEMPYYTPQRRANLNRWVPSYDPVVALTGRDYSGNGNDCVVNGAPVLEDGPPIAWAPQARRYFLPVKAAAPTGPPAGSLGLLGVGR